MNIIIPIGGIGKRFTEQGYTQPKPLIKALGRPIIFWVIDSLEILDNDTIFIIYRSEFIQSGFTTIIKGEYPDKNIVFIPLFHDTEGSADTVMECLKSPQISSQLHKPTLIVDSDSYSNNNIISYLRKEAKNIIFCCSDTNPEPRYSYIKTDNDRVIEIKEKVKISDKICIGSYAFSSGKFLLDTIIQIKKDNNSLKYAKEFYMSSVYAYIIEHDLAPIYYIDITSFHCLGTPIQLQDFCNMKQTEEKYRFCFDLDNTLVTKPVTKGDYNTVLPIEKNIQLLRKLYEQGHVIIIHSARHMRTTQGNIGSVMARVGQTVFKNLADFDIPYHELYLGKPYAHFYIDDLAVNANSDLEKSLGFYNLYPPIRQHHQGINFTEKTTTKHSDNIQGEIWWYKNIPEKLTKYFPTVYETGKSILKMERIRGIPLSYMLINQTIGCEHITDVIGILRDIHTTSPNKTQRLVDTSELYSKKYFKRLQCHDFSSYKDFDNVNHKITTFLHEYESRASNDKIIHGDPVFTNILLDLDKHYKFIDMRGKVGDVLTIMGDPNYDYAKVYQSLCGYEYVLLDREPNETFLTTLRKSFEGLFDNIDDIRMITASLFITLIPLHPKHKAEKYYELAYKLV